MVGKARAPTTYPGIIQYQNYVTNPELYSLFRQKITGGSSGFVSITGGNSPSVPGGTGRFVRIEGDQMHGPLAFRAKVINMDSQGIVDISKSALVGHSSRVVVLGEGSVDDDINFIRADDVQSGQILYIQGVIGINLTFKNKQTPTDTSLIPIRTESGTDLTQIGNRIWELQYDESANEFAIIAGFGTGAGGGGGSNLLSDLVINVDKDWAGRDITNLGDLKPTVDKDLGDTSNPWRNGFIKNLRLQPGTITVNKPMLTASNLDNMILNVPNGGFFDFRWQGVNAWTLNEFTLSGANIILSNTFTINDSSFTANANGMFSRDGSDVYVYSGGAARNLSNVGVAASGANVFLSNLNSPVAINQDLLFGVADLDIGDTTTPVGDVFAKQIRLQAGTVTTNVPMLTRDGSDNMQINFPSAKKIFFLENGVTKWDMSGTTITGPNIILSNTLTINDSSTDPSTNGQFSRNSTDIKVFSGGAVRNLSSIGTGSTFENPAVAALDMDGNDIIIDADGDSRFRFNVDDTVTVQLGGASKFVFGASVHNAQNLRIEEVADPIAAQDVATKSYVDSNGGGANNLNDLNDVAISGLAVQNVLSYTGSQWVNRNLSQAGIAQQNLGNLGTTAINSHLLPAADNLIDVGSASLQMRNGYFDGTVFADGLSMGGDIDLNGHDIESGSSILVNVGGGETARFTSSEFRMASGHHIDFGNNISLSATGGFVSVPTQALGFIIVQVNGGFARIPYYGV